MQKKLLAVICLTSLVLSVQGCKNAFESGTEELNKGNWQKAKEYFLEIDRDQSQYQQAQAEVKYCETKINLEEGVQLVKRRDWNGAILYFTKIDSSDPQYASNEIGRRISICRLWLKFDGLENDADRFEWLTAMMERYNTFCGYTKAPIGCVGMICDIFKESQRAAKSATKTIFKGKRDYFYFRTHGGHGPKNYGADFVLNPGISGANDFRIYYFGIDCLMYYESGNMQEAWATSRIAPDYVFLNQIPLVSRQYLNALAKFKGLQEYKDQYDQAILKPTFSVVAILMHNATYSGEITQPVYSWGNLDAVMEDFAKLPQ